MQSTKLIAERAFVKRVICGGGTCNSHRRFFASLASANDEEEATIKNAFGGTYDWKDPFQFRQQLSEEEVIIWDAARDFCQGELQVSPGKWCDPLFLFVL